MEQMKNVVHKLEQDLKDFGIQCHRVLSKAAILELENSVTLGISIVSAAFVQRFLRVNNSSQKSDSVLDLLSTVLPKSCQVDVL